MIFVYRESALVHASSKSLFSKTERQARPREVYPHVYDEAHNSQATFGFVAGTKVGLSGLSGLSGLLGLFGLLGLLQ